MNLRIKMRKNTLCKIRWGLVRPRGPTPEHPAHASRSDQDSYVTKGGPLANITDLMQQSLYSFVCLLQTMEQLEEFSD